MTRRNVSSGTAWEVRYGYSRAVRVGNVVEVAGTTAVDADGHVVGAGDAYAQTRFILEKIERALQETGARMEHVIRTRAFVTDIRIWEDVGRAHAERFASIRPAATLVAVSALVHPELLVEIEATAHVSET